LLDQPLLALFCSRACPGSVILRAYDLAVALRDAGVPVIGGYQTPLERELLAVLLRGRQPVVIVEARGARARPPVDWRQAVDAGRLLVVAPFPGTRRPTARTADARNRIVAGLASAVLVAHAAPGGRTETLAGEVAACGVPLVTIDDAANVSLIALGATPLDARRERWPPEIGWLCAPARYASSA
jgi:predicted Rossmann fold nucleotide-binding protein DprA/Smf involved in DNA uptake